MALKQKGEKNCYELTVVLQAELSDAKDTAVISKINDIIKGYEGTVTYQEDLGKKRLAYEIKKETRGRYLYWLFTARAACIAELERNLRLNDGVLRFLTIRLSEEEHGDVEKYMKDKGKRSNENNEYQKAEM